MPPTSIKDALQRWEKKTGQSASEAKIIELQYQWWPITEMDKSLSTLVNCEKLSLSSNLIKEIVELNGLLNLKILSLSRNSIKSLVGIEVLANSLEQLWISYNNINELTPIKQMKKLQVFYIGYNGISDLDEIDKLEELPMLKNVRFIGNPAVQTMNLDDYRAKVLSKLPNLILLDGLPNLTVKSF